MNKSKSVYREVDELTRKSSNAIRVIGVNRIQVGKSSTIGSGKSLCRKDIR